MSHVTTVDVKINNLDALKEACNELKVQFVEGQKTYKWYNHHVGDYPLPKGFKVSDLGKCEHAIRVPGVQYEVGVVKHPNGDGTFTLLYDFWGPGRGLLDKFGPECQKIVQTYAKHATIQQFKADGYIVEEETQDKQGNIQLVVTKPY